MTNKLGEITLRVAAVYEALSSIDDCARMGIGVDAMGPRKVLEQFIADVEKLAELSKQEPVGYVDYGDRVEWYSKPAPETDLFTHPVNTADIEQRVAEAIADYVDTELRPPNEYVEAIRSGKWREHL